MRATPPGPKGAPVIGNARRFARDPFAFMDACRDAYGDVTKLAVGDRPAYLLTDPAAVERVLVSESRAFGKADFDDDGAALLGNGLLTSEGDFWRRERRRVQPAFDTGRVAGLTRMMTGHTEAMTEGWRAGGEIEIDREMARLTVRIITDAMFGVTASNDTIDRIQSNLEPLGRRFEPNVLDALIPDWFPTEENRAYNAALADLETVLSDLVADRRNTAFDPSVDDATESQYPMDMLSILLRARKEVGEVDDDLLRDELMTILLAGHDTTALALTYTWYLLARNPETEARLHGELDSVLEGRTPTMADVRDLEFTERVLKEAMRVYPPVYTMFREARADARFGGYRIPRDSLIMLPQWVIHRDSRWYENPTEFDPDRWLPDRVAGRPNYAYFPFGAGPRHCIGKRFSLLEATLILATVAQNYRLEPVSGDALDLRGSITMHPAEPIRATLEPR